MPLIDPTYFIGEINIPRTSNPDIAERIAFFIESYEDKLLRDILGYTLWKAFSDGIIAGSPDQKWIDIRDGKEYTGLDGYLTKWDGLLIKKESTILKQSLIANYVYWYWQKDNVSQTVTIGEATAKAENSTLITPKSKMISAWNQMVDWICQLHCFLNANITVYPEWERRNNFFQMRKYRKQNHFDI